MFLLSSVTRLLAFRQLKVKHWILLLSLFTLIYVPAILHDDGTANAYVLLAKSFCHGKISLSTQNMPYVQGTEILSTGDMISYNGKYYLPYPPFPALLILPFLLVGGGYVNSILIAVLLSCLNLVLFYRILKKTNLAETYIPWLTWGFFFGTSYWFVLLSSRFVYEFAQIVSVTGILLLLNELFGKKRGILLGIFLGISFLSRQFTLFMGLFVLGYFIYHYLMHPREREGGRAALRRKTLLFCGTVSLFLLLGLVYNYIRFGNALDTGYQYILFIGVLKDRVDQYGVFSTHYVLYNLYHYLLKGFNIEFTGPGLLKIKDMDPLGTSLFAASPFLIAAFKAEWPRILKIFAWIPIVAIFTGLLFYHNNGKDQVNASRFTLDFLPLFFILTGLGAKHIPSWLFKGMVLYAIAINLIATGIHLQYHTLK